MDQRRDPTVRNVLEAMERRPSKLYEPLDQGGDPTVGVVLMVGGWALKNYAHRRFKIWAEVSYYVGAHYFMG